MMPSSQREDGALAEDLCLWSPRRQLHRGRAERNKVRRPSMYTNLVNGNWLLLVTRTGPGTKSSGFSIKQCQILMIFLFPASRMNSLTLPVVLMNVCYCLPLLLSFCCHFQQLLAGMERWYFSAFFLFTTSQQTKPALIWYNYWTQLDVKWNFCSLR